LLFDKANAFWSRLPLRYVGASLIAVPALGLVVTLSAWGISQQLANELYQKIDLTKTRIFDSKDLLIHLLNAETGSRGFSLTRNPKFLEPYNAAIANIPTLITRLKQESQTNLERQKIEEIERLAEQKLATISKSIAQNKIESERQLAFPLAREQKLFAESKQTMDKMRTLIDALEREQVQYLQQYENRLLKNRAITRNIFWITVAIGLLICCKILFLFSKTDWRLQDKEWELNQSNLLIKGITDNVVDGVITLNQRDEIDSFNITASQMFGYSPEEAIGLSFSSLISTKKPLEGWLSNYNTPFSGRGHRQNGTDFPVEVSISKLPLARGKISIVRDITECQETQKKLEASVNELSRLSFMLSETNQTLIDRNRELDQFAYVASHDLKAPLRAVSSLSEWIEEDLADKLTPENQYQMRLLRQRVSRMEALINGLLEYCRVGRNNTKLEIVDVEALLQEIVDSLGVQSGFRVEISPNMPAITTNKLLLRQIFANLISNAIKHQQKSEGNVQITWKDLDLFYQFAVTDDGPGIAPEYQEQIFKIFQTLEARDTQENTGIGLAIVKKIVESAGGTVEVESDLGKGATFRFTWPKKYKELEELSL
jgi:PAS domain S-box-containing protein